MSQTATATLRTAVAGGSGSGSYDELQNHPDDYGPYPFNPHTAFHRLEPREVDEVQVQEEAARETAGKFCVQVVPATSCGGLKLTRCSRSSCDRLSASHGPLRRERSHIREPRRNS